MATQPEDIRQVERYLDTLTNGVLGDFQEGLNIILLREGKEMVVGSDRASTVTHIDENYHYISSFLVNENPAENWDIPFVNLLANKCNTPIDKNFVNITDKELYNADKEDIGLFGVGVGDAGASAHGPTANNNPVYLEINPPEVNSHRTRAASQDDIDKVKKTFTGFNSNLVRGGGFRGNPTTTMRVSHRAAKAVRKEMKQGDENTNNRAAPNDPAPDPRRDLKPGN